MRGACNLVSAFRVVPLAISRYGCGLCNALSGIDQWLLRFAFFKKAQNYLGFRDTLKRNTHSVYFLYSG